MLVEMARDLNVALVGVAELRQRSRQRLFSGEVRTRFLADAAHVVWGVARDPSQRDQSWLFPLKRCLARDEPPLALKHDGGKLEWSTGPGELTTNVVGESRQSPTARVGGPRKNSTHPTELLRPVVANWLRGVLLNGSRAAVEIQETAKEAGFSRNLLREVMVEIGVRVHKAGYRGKSMCSLPNSPEDAAWPAIEMEDEARVRCVEPARAALRLYSP